MMKLIKLMMFGLLIFAIAAGGSWFALSKQHAAKYAEDAGSHDVANETDPHGDDAHAEIFAQGAFGDFFINQK